MVEYLPSKGKALSSNLIPNKTKEINKTNFRGKKDYLDMVSLIKDPTRQLGSRLLSDNNAIKIRF
jgi:hypothetical protein